MNKFLQFQFTSIWVLAFCTSPALSHTKNSPVLSRPPLKPTPEMKVPLQDKHIHADNGSLFIVIFIPVALALMILWSCCAFIFWQRKGLNSNAGKVRSSDTSRPHTGGPILDRFNPLSILGSIPKIDYTLIETATNNFSESNILGRGRIGYVYKAVLSSGTLAAVRKLDAKEPCCESLFENEIALLSNIVNPNIVSLLGYSVHWDTRLLIYEFMERGSLEKQLHGTTGGMALTWKIRMKIALDVARGLEYLHQQCNPPVIHTDLNPSNILLDSSFNAKISGLGLAVVGGNENKSRIQYQGALGYEAPEYLLRGELTAKSDIYALGVVILELLMGRKTVEELARSQFQSITTWAMPQLTDREKIPNIVDPVIRHTMDLKHLCQVAAITGLCVQPEPSYRPVITDVVYSLAPLVHFELGGELRISDPNPRKAQNPLLSDYLSSFHF